MKKVILDLCGGSGAWSKPYADSGYDVRIVTLPKHDVRGYIPPERVHGILAAPPCTQFSHALSEKIKRDIKAGLEVVHACQRIVTQAKQNGLKWWAMENPRGHLRRHIGAPKMTFQPWEFGDPWTKCTDIWGDFKIPERTNRSYETVIENPALYKRPGRGKCNFIWLHKSAYDLIPSLHRLPRPESDAAFRAMTPQGFARSFFQANP